MAHVAVLPIWLDDRILRQFFQGRVFYLNHWMKDRKIPETRADILGALNSIELTFRALLGCADFKDVFLEFSTHPHDEQEFDPRTRRVLEGTAGGHPYEGFRGATAPLLL
jgi:hypothetical protein